MRIKKFEPGTRLEIEWQDILTDSKWHTKDEAEKVDVVQVKTIGYFLKNHKKVMKIAHSVAAGGDCDITCIPHGCIQNVKILEE